MSVFDLRIAHFISYGAHIGHTKKNTLMGAA